MLVPPCWVVCGINKCRLLFRAYRLFLSLTYCVPTVSGTHRDQAGGAGTSRLAWSLEPTEDSARETSGFCGCYEALCLLHVALPRQTL